MKKKLCIIHANCQGGPLTTLLRQHPVFSNTYRIKHIVNYTREIIPDDDLRNCQLFLYQWLSKDWNELSSERLLSRLPSNAQPVCIPNLFFKHYWPLWDSKPGIDYSDRHLNMLIQRGLSAIEIIHIYLKTDIFKLYDIHTSLARSEEHERQKEQRWDIKVTDDILATYRQEALFSTINHPGLGLQIRIAQGVLDLLGYGPLSQTVLRAAHDAFGEFFLPIHPHVTQQLGLTFADNMKDYPVYGTRLTIKEYLLAYITCRQEGISDFISFLILYAQKHNRHEAPLT
ncbi:WcbI family polysaccharide biosynthesis putative acetyltransferase [Desulfovibrio inopinatus]|uniref:WcbI family polysaccharide biosynthesis putative acetyltransferase n=1 Tax=Desulfovibrio inopinatus TaxID=102109 RepID=UPI000429BFFA|nr:WcbI family polysaccharide biosynthesis putative acetyltransferase [Desulfovibrio inopinatus]